jgi:uncharacterized RDD family membrane protein YckC
MSAEQKKCPLCAEEIPLTTTVCGFCGAQFEVTRTGYCQNCHEVRTADGEDRCNVCGGMLLDVHAESRFTGEVPFVRVPASPPLVAPARGQVGEQPSELVVLPVRGEGVNWRFNAVFLDGLIIGFVYTLVILILMLVGGGLASLVRFDREAFMSAYGRILLFSFPVIWFLYFFILEGFFGTTPGKAASYLRVIKKEGGRITWWQAALRSLLSVFECNLIGAVVIWSTRLKQRLGDLLAGTLVVQKEKVHKVEFKPPAITFEFHDYRRTALTQITYGVVRKFGRIRQLILTGPSEDGSLVKVTINGHFFRPQFDMLRLNIEQRYGLRFPEKIIVWRLVLVIVDSLFLLAAIVVFIVALLNLQNR